MNALQPIEKAYPVGEIFLAHGEMVIVKGHMPALETIFVEDENGEKKSLARGVMREVK